MTESEETELEMLREFFDCWCTFHGIQRGHREEQERAAQRMVDAANSIKAFRAPAPAVVN
jgi:hypothetical protein